MSATEAQIIDVHQQMKKYLAKLDSADQTIVLREAPREVLWDLLIKSFQEILVHEQIAAFLLTEIRRLIAEANDSEDAAANGPSQ